MYDFVELPGSGLESGKRRVQLFLQLPIPRQRFRVFVQERNSGEIVRNLEVEGAQLKLGIHAEVTDQETVD